MGLVQRLFGIGRSNSDTVGGTIRISGRSYSAQWNFTRTLDSVYGNPTGRRCVERIASDFQRPDWQLRKQGTEDDLKEDEATDAYAVLNQPNPSMSGTLAQYHIARDLELAGGAHWLKISGSWDNPEIGGHRLIGLRRLAPQRITVIADEDDELLGFIYQDRLGRAMPILPEDCIYVHYPHPDRAADRMAPALVAGLSAETDISAMRFNYELLTNDSALPGYLTVEGLTPPQFAAWTAQWEGNDQPGRTRFLGGGNAKYVKVGQTNQELTYNDLRTASREDICRAFGVARVLIDPTDSTFANMEQAAASHIKSLISPKWTMVADEFTRQLGPDLGGFDVGFNLDQIEELNEGEGAVIDRDLKLLDKGAITINHLRRDIGLEDVDWGDQRVASLREAVESVGALVRAGFDPTAALAAVGLDPITHTGLVPVTVQGENLAEGAGAPPPAQRALEASAELVLKELGAGTRNLTTKQVVTIDGFDRRVERQERSAERTLERFFERQGKAIEARIRSKKGKAFNKAADDWWDGERWNEELTRLSAPIIGDAVDSIGTLALGALVSDSDFDMENERITEYLDARSVAIAELVNETTAADVRRVLADQSASGASIDDMAKAVSDLFTEQKTMRAQRVARTEIIGAANWAATEAARQSGVVSAKTWLAASTAEEDCAALSGVSVPLDEGFGTVSEPPLHPNCRCTLTFELKETS